MKITHFYSFCWKHGEPLCVFFFYAKKIEAQTRMKGTEEDLMSRRRHDNMDISLYFLSIILKLFPTNTASDNSLESALNVCCLCEETLYLLLPG